MDNEPIDRQDDLKAIRRANRLAQERLRAEQLAHAGKQFRERQLRESYNSAWVGPWLDAITTARGDLMPFGPASMWQRSRGQNYPVYRTEHDLALLRFPSRWMCATGGYAVGFVNGLKGYVLGSGLTYRVCLKDDENTTDEPLKDTLQTVVDDILEANEWYGGELPGFEEEYFERTIEDGEAFAMHFPGNDGLTSYRFADPEQVTEVPGMVGDEFAFGVRVDPDDVEKPIEYCVAWDEAKTDYDLFNADRMTHFRRNAKRKMKRGVPDFSFDTYDSLDAATKLKSNMGEAAAQQAAIVSVMKFKTGTQSEIQAVASSNDFYDFNPYSGQQIGVRKTPRGTNEYIPDSQEYTTGPAMSNATAHGEVLKTLLRAACVRWNAPDWLGSADASGNTFKNAAEVSTTFANRIAREQRRYCATFRRMIWYGVESWCKAKGMNWDDVKSKVDLVVKAPEPVKSDPLSDAQVAAIEIPLGLQSRQAYAMEKGRDWKSIERDNAEWQADHADELTPADEAKATKDADEDKPTDA